MIVKASPMHGINSQLALKVPKSWMAPNKDKELHKFYKGLTCEDVRWINATSKEGLRTISFDQVRELLETQTAAQNMA